LKSKKFPKELEDVFNQMPLSEDQDLVEKWNEIGPLSLESIVKMSLTIEDGEVETYLKQQKFNNGYSLSYVGTDTFWGQVD
jgi:hypothetical protein